MKKCMVFFVLIISVAYAVSSYGADAPARSLHVIPEPKKIVWRTGAFLCDKDTYIIISNPADETQKLAAEQIREEVKHDMGIDVAMRTAVDPAGHGKPVVLGIFASDAIVRKSAVRHGIAASDLTIPEGYTLSIGGKFDRTRRCGCRRRCSGR